MPTARELCNLLRVEQFERRRHIGANEADGRGHGSRRVAFLPASHSRPYSLDLPASA
jgi:hypothetical protein